MSKFSSDCFYDNDVILAPWRFKSPATRLAQADKNILYQICFLSWWTMDSPDKGTVMRKIFPCHDSLMFMNTLDGSHHSGANSLHWRHNGCDGVSIHQTHDCLLNRLLRRRPKKTSKLRTAGLCAGNSPVTGAFRAQRDSNAENVSILWCHHDTVREGSVSGCNMSGNLYDIF